jgi:hypothetical protein
MAHLECVSQSRLGRLRRMRGPNTRPRNASSSPLQRATSGQGKLPKEKPRQAKESEMALFFYNGTGQTVWISFAFFDRSCGDPNQNFRKLGWWQLDSNSRFNAWDVDLRTVNRFAYFYVEAADGSNWHGAGNAWLGITNAAFNQCAFDVTGDDRWEDFIDLDFTWADPGWNTEVIIWHWEGLNRITFYQQKDNGTVGPIAPDVPPQ